MNKLVLPCCLALVLTLALPGPWRGTATAQNQPTAPTRQITKEVPDPLANLRRYFRSRVPTGWWFDTPVKLPVGYRVTVHIPSHWRGNPTGAMLNLCPYRNDPVWADVDLIDIQYGYHSTLGPSVVCRR